MYLHQCILWNNNDQSVVSPWRNRLACSAVNRKDGGSSPPGDESFALTKRQYIYFLFYIYIFFQTRHYLKTTRVITVIARCAFGQNVTLIVATSAAHGDLAVSFFAFLSCHNRCKNHYQVLFLIHQMLCVKLRGKYQVNFTRERKP